MISTSAQCLPPGEGMTFRGSFSVCRSNPFLLNFDIFSRFGGLSNTHQKELRFSSLSWKAVRSVVESCGRFRRGSNFCEDKRGWGFLFRVSSRDKRKERSRGWHSHREQGLYHSMLSACDLNHKKLNKVFENHYTCLDLKSSNTDSKRLGREAGHSARKLEGCHTNQVLHFCNRICAQIDGGSDKIFQKDESLIGLNSQESDFKSARTSVPSVSKQSKPRKKAALAIFKTLDMQSSSAEDVFEEAEYSTLITKAKRQIPSETLNDNPRSPFVSILADQGTAKLATSFEEGNYMETREQQKPSVAKEEPMKMPPKRKKYTPETQLRWELDMCSKSANFLRAIEIYEKTIKEGELSFNQYHYNIVLYLCSAVALGVLEPRKSGNCSSQQATKGCGFDSESDNTQNREPGIDQNGSASLDEGLGGSMAGFVGKNVMGISKEMMDFAKKRGFQIYQDMCSLGVPRNEATFTAIARLAVADSDGDLAFQMVKEMIAENMSPRLRSYGPALYIYYKKKNVEKAFEVDNHMLQYGIMPEETELQVLLGLSSEAGLAEKVYSLLHRLRTTVRDLAPSTADAIEQWFNSKAAESAKMPSQGVPRREEVMSAMVSKGGGWHGLGWLGSGRWQVGKTTIDKNGFCQCCGEHLVTIDIDPLETEKFQQSLATLAYERANFGNTFKNFQDWLDQHGPFDAVVDGANIAMYNQNFQGSGFNFSQLNTVVSELQRLHPSRRLPLTILHNKRANGVRATNPLAQRVLNEWSKSHAFYSTPTGSNDDWYWLYAAVKNKCLIVTNDEMRDHLFQLLGKDFFPKWKERHQVRFTLPGRSANFHMPPPYSIVIQESITGSWHIPKAGGDDVVSPREWLCITRPHGVFMKDSLFEQEKASALQSVGGELGLPLRSISGEDNGSLTPGKVTKRSSPMKS